METRIVQLYKQIIIKILILLQHDTYEIFIQKLFIFRHSNMIKLHNEYFLFLKLTVFIWENKPVDRKYKQLVQNITSDRF